MSDSLWSQQQEAMNRAIGMPLSALRQGTANAACTKESAPIEDAIVRLADEADCLEKAIAALRAKASPVLRPAEERLAGPSAPTHQEVCSPVADRLGAIFRALRECRSSLDEIHGRIEV